LATKDTKSSHLYTYKQVVHKELKPCICKLVHGKTLKIQCRAYSNIFISIQRLPKSIHDTEIKKTLN
jgi:hypothetical protein